MRIIFMGTPQFAADILEEVAEHFDVVCIYTQPDRVRGRNGKVIPTPVKELGERLEIEVRTPVGLRNDVEESYIRELAPDVICVAAYGALLPAQILDIPTYGCLNVHASMLPRWRGAAPIERAILAGDEYVGICIMQMEEGLDTGDYCVSRRIPVDGKNASELTSDLAMLGARSLITALTLIDAGEANWVKQDDSKSTYAAKIEKGELDLYPSYSTAKNLRLVQASSPAHPARAKIGGRDCVIGKAKSIERKEAEPLFDLAGGHIYEGDAITNDGRLYLCDSDGFVEVTHIKPAGKKMMQTKDFLNGAKLSSVDRWTSV